MAKRWHEYASPSIRRKAASHDDTGKLVASLLSKGKTRSAEILLGVPRGSLGGSKRRAESTTDLLTEKGRQRAAAQLPESMRRGFGLEGSPKAKIEGTKVSAGEVDQRQLERLRASIKDKSVLEAFGLADAPQSRLEGTKLICEAPTPTPQNGSQAATALLTTAAGRRAATAIVGGM